MKNISSSKSKQHVCKCDKWCCQDIPLPYDYIILAVAGIIIAYVFVQAAML